MALSLSRRVPYRLRQPDPRPPPDPSGTRLGRKRLYPRGVHLRVQRDVRLTAATVFAAVHCRTEGCEVWGVGEAVGCVAPLAGDGIVPGMKSVMPSDETLGRSCRVYEGPAQGVRLDEGRTQSDRQAAKKGKARARDAWTLKRNSKRMSMAVKLWQASALMKHLQ